MQKTESRCNKSSPLDDVSSSRYAGFFKYWKLGKRRKVLCEVPNFECLITTFNLDYKPRDSRFKCETPKLSWFDRYVISGYNNVL